MNNFKKYLTYNSFSVLLLGLYPLALALGSFVSELLNFSIIFFFFVKFQKELNCQSY